MLNNSMIWAEGDDKASFADFSFVDKLNLGAIININAGKKLGERDRDLREYFTLNTDTINMRVELFEELLADPELFKGIDNAFSQLDVFFEAQKIKGNATSNEQILYEIKILEDYTDFLNSLKKLFVTKEVTSKSLNALRMSVAPIYTDEEFDSLCTAIKEQVHSIHKIKSVTLGVNLDANLQPIEAGVVTVHEEPYISGDFLDKLLRLDFKNNDFYCTAPLVPFGREFKSQDIMFFRNSVNASINRMFQTSIKSWSKVVKSFVIKNLLPLTNYLEEWKFISVCVNALNDLKKAGFKLCRPVFGNADNVAGLYHPVLALNVSTSLHIVTNELEFNSDNGIYILTGPNQGGKSIYMQSVGLLYAMLHLGLPLPASKAVARPVDAILVHFIDIKNRSYVHGRLSDECDKIHTINQMITENSLFLFDEALSSTNAVEAVAISDEILTAYSDIGARGIWATHLHELCALETSYTGGKSKIGNLSAQIDENSHERVYKIVRGDSNQSYAMDIAKKYNLTKAEILSERKGK